MKIGVIGANGRLGTKVVREALNRGYEVRSFIVTGEGADPREELIVKSLFDLDKENLKGLDCVISTFGGGFHADPVINKHAFEKYAQLSEDSGLHFTVIGGAGTLYPDHSHTKHEYENMDPQKPLYGISKNICEGVEELKKAGSGHWTVVSPSQKFDFEGERHASYRIGKDQELLYNSNGESYLTYEDMAKCLVDICNDPSYEREILTVLSEI